MDLDWSLQLKGGWKRYSADILFENLDLQIDPAKAIRVSGANGSGKTQLLLALSGLVAFDRGDLQLKEGHRVRSLPPDPHARDRYIRFVPERIGALASFPAGEVVLALSREMSATSFRSRRRAAARRFGLDEARLRAVVGAYVDSQLPAARLSIGQQKRLSIGAIGCLPKALLFDEPLTGLDEEGIRQVLQLMTDFRRAGVAIVVAEHRTEIDSFNFDEVIAMPFRRSNTDADVTVGRTATLVPPRGPDFDECRLVLRNLRAGYPGSEISCRELVVRRGEVARIIGSNGAGKTGFLKALVGAGPARLQGHVELDGRISSDLHGFLASGTVRYMSQDRRTFPELTVSDALGAASIAGNDRLPDEIRELARIVGAQKRVADLSSGNRALVVLGQTLASRPRLALLDEPLANVDIENRRRMIALIAHARSSWGTSFLSVEHGETETFEDVRYHIVRDHDRSELQRLLLPVATMG